MLKRFLTISIFLTTLSLYASIPFVANAQISIAPKNPDSRDFNFEIEPGQSDQDTLLIKNLSTKKTKVKVYAVDASKSQDGTLGFTTSNSEQNSIGKWVKITEPETQIPGQSLKEASFTVSIPANATPGTYAGGIAAEEIKYNGQSQVTISARIVSKIFITIPGEIVNKYEWSSLENIESAGENKFHLEFENTGTSLLTLKPEIEIDGFPLAKNQKLSSPEISVLQGEKSKIEIPWEEAPKWGILNAKVNLEIGQYNFLNRSSNKLEVLTKELKIVLIPWWFLGPIVGIFAAIILVWLYLRSRIGNLRKNSVAYTVNDGETISSIAAVHKIKWQLLAKMNRMKAPYSLTKGQEILVPKTPDEENN